MRAFSRRNIFGCSLFVASAVLVAVSFVWALRALHAVREPLIIHFNAAVGIDQIGSLQDLAGVAVLSLVVVAVNFLLFAELEKRDWLWSVVAASATLVYAVLIFLGFAAIISANS